MNFFNSKVVQPALPAVAEAASETPALTDFPEYLEARDTVNRLKAKLAEIEARRANAEARYFSAMQAVRAAPPAHLACHVETIEAEVHEQQASLRDAEQRLLRVAGECRTRICRGLAPQHRRLRMHIAEKLRELLNAVRAEQNFREDLANRDVLVTGPNTINPVCLPGISTPDELEGLQIALELLKEEL